MTETTKTEQYAKTVHLTEQQIDDFCKPIEDLANAAGWDYADEAIAVQIIRQLQGEAAECAVIEWKVVKYKNHAKFF